jgi:hypothetical protein
MVDGDENTSPTQILMGLSSSMDGTYSIKNRTQTIVAIPKGLGVANTTSGIGIALSSRS